MIKWYNVKKSMMIRKLWIMFWYCNKIESWRWKKQKFQKWYILRDQNVIQTLRRMNVDIRISIFEIIWFSMFECWHDMTFWFEMTTRKSFTFFVIVEWNAWRKQIFSMFFKFMRTTSTKSFNSFYDDQSKNTKLNDSKK